MMVTKVICVVHAIGLMHAIYVCKCVMASVKILCKKNTVVQWSLITCHVIYRRIAPVVYCSNHYAYRSITQDM